MHEEHSADSRKVSKYDLYDLAILVREHKNLTLTQKLAIIYVMASPDKVGADWLR